MIRRLNFIDGVIRVTQTFHFYVHLRSPDISNIVRPKPECIQIANGLVVVRCVCVRVWCVVCVVGVWCVVWCVVCVRVCVCVCMCVCLYVCYCYGWEGG